MSLLSNLLWVYRLSMGDSFIRLFTEMTPLVCVLFILGILLCFIELFIPGFGVFGISGVVLMIVAIILRMVSGGDVYMLVYMFAISLLIIGGMFALVSRSARKGALSKSKIFDVGTSVPTGHTEGTRDYSALIGMKGTALTFLRPVGKADFGGQTVDVVAKCNIIEAGQKIKVVEVEGQRVVVDIDVD